MGEDDATWLAEDLMLTATQPPWHLWGNSQVITTTMEDTAVFRTGTTQQLIKASYGRPETWHWVFAARMLSGPDNDPGFFSRVIVQFDLVIGVGRSLIRMTSEAPPFGVQPFEEYQFKWGPTNPAFPVGANLYTAQAESPRRFFDTEGPPTTPPGPPITQIVAQEIQLNAQVIAITTPLNVGAVGQPVTVEVSAVFAPASHVRPDWFLLDKELAEQFPGGEIGGR